MTLLEFQRNPREVIGGNNPPGPIDSGRDVYRIAAAFLQNNPTIDAESAPAANDALTSARLTVRALEEDRDAECDPLHASWKAAREKWRPSIEAMTRVRDDVASRLGAYMRAEEDRRKAEAAEAKRVADEFERAAREAERLEAEARDNAEHGEFVDTVAASEAADEAFDDFKQAERAAHFAEKDVTVKLRSRFAAKATKLRTKRKLVITDVNALLLAIGITEGVEAALLTAARAYRTSLGKWPEGVSEETERKL
jgi:hypothetical protein